ncbi:MAG: bacillithiol system redox-active protein YtxJ [Acidobacteria bacterium]|nr:bacillithiol system redox-active protein YtxJ [Acidobacteriota bacterium]MCZ6726279.1 bacillithiol system redox-active protein YtxJ [Acidobacteriota bacterium]
MSEIEKVETTEDLDRHVAASFDGDIWFFKHSLTCGVSSAAWREFERFAGEQPAEGGVRFCLIEIQSSRPISRSLAERLDVRHQSPQAILVRGGKAVWHATHFSITSRALAAAGAQARESQA